MSIVTLTVGVSASGKSTWARQIAKANGVVVVCRDDIRISQGLVYNDNEDLVTKIQRANIAAAVKMGSDVIVADTNINKKFREDLIRFCHRLGADVEILTFHINIDEAIRRDQNREARVGAAVILNQFNQLQPQNVKNEYLPVKSYSEYEHRDGLPRRFVFDIDGTIARHVNRSPYDYSRVSHDEVIEDVGEILLSLIDSGNKIVFVSGREDSCMNETVTWLRDKALLGDHADFEIYMRKTGDKRPDWVVKNEIYDTHLIPRYNIVAVFDDRDQVVTHLRRRGITVVQVAEGDF